MPEENKLISKLGAFTALPNTTALDTRLSLKAKGLLLILSSKATLGGWMFDKAWVMKQSETDGHASFEAAFKMLKHYGYLAIKKQGRYSWLWEIDVTGKLHSEKQHIEKQHIENHPLTKNTELNKTKNKEKKDMKRKGTVTINPLPCGIPCTSELEDIVKDLNKRLGTGFKNSLTTNKMLKARLNEGFAVEDFKEVHRKKIKQWKHDPKMKEFLRPKTLYCAANFENYLNGVEVEGVAPEPINRRVYTEKAEYERAVAAGKKNIVYNPNHVILYD